jgi:transposase
LPAYSPELNPAEKVWQYLKDNFLSHKIWDDVSDIVDDACAAWNALISEIGRIKSAAAFTIFPLEI